jgi:hypothetical protein
MFAFNLPSADVEERCLPEFSSKTSVSKGVLLRKVKF